jgi:predicted lipoprotein with Yx(FWY)xxD motif
MRPSRDKRRTRAWIAVAAVALSTSIAFAACGDDSGDNGDGGSGEGSAAETLSIESIGDAGDVLVNPNGSALYTPEEEAGGKILCTGECTSIWAPITVQKGQQPTGPSEIEADLGTVERPDGTVQVTFQGAPLYSFTQEGAGEVTGDGVEDSFGGTDFIWHAVTSGGGGGGASGSESSDSSQGGGGYGY